MTQAVRFAWPTSLRTGIQLVFRWTAVCWLPTAASEVFEILSDQLKTGQRRSGQNRPTREAGTELFYSAASFGGKLVFVRQLRGPHLSTCP